MKILQNFTGDRHRVLAAIGQPVGSDPAGLSYFLEMPAALKKISG
jgi:hypothetical protein